METFLRRIAILEYLRHSRQARSTQAIAEHLLEGGYLDSGLVRNSCLRVVQRDLRFLLGEEPGEEADNPFGLQLERRGSRSLFWSLDRQAALRLDFERMPQNQAIALALLRKHLGKLLPKHSREELESVFEVAEARLLQAEKKLSQHHFMRLRDAVAFFQRGQSLRPPVYDNDVIESIYQAILHGRQIRLYYQKRREYRVSPCGLAYLLPKIYLVARNEQGQYRHFLLTRIEGCEVLSVSSQLEPDFDLETYLQQGGMEMPLNPGDSELHAIRLSIDPEVGEGLLRDLKEYPLNDAQLLTLRSDGRWELSFQSRLSIQLRNWVISLGGAVCVEGPDSLKEAVKTHLVRALAGYAPASEVV